DVPPPEKKDEKQTTTTVTRVDELFTSLPDKPREDITRDSAPEPSLEEQILSDVKELAQNPEQTPKEVIKLMDKYSDAFGFSKDLIAQYKKFFRIEE
ncbi:hypothetical protein KY342_00730, partial [Candidatus Woesearchaeota archaeon]|nr:hypothetical protein [Candidatus Woesearchaeota archaeon]